MAKYHKINTVFNREPKGKRRIIEGEYSEPEFEYLSQNTWVATEKVDGTNIRVYIEDGKIRLAGRTDDSQLPMSLVENIQSHFSDKEDILRECFKEGNEGCLYGEGYGPKIQKVGALYREDPGFVLFDININGWWLERSAVESLAAQLGLDVVPIVSEGTLTDLIEEVRAGVVSHWGDFEAEGYVMRPKVELKTRAGRRIITKLKCKDFAD